MNSSKLEDLHQEYLNLMAKNWTFNGVQPYPDWISSDLLAQYDGTKCHLDDMLYNEIDCDTLSYFFGENEIMLDLIMTNWGELECH